MTVISVFRFTQHSQIFSLFFRNRIQCIALYQLHNSQALLNLRRGYFRCNCRVQTIKCECFKLDINNNFSWGRSHRLYLNLETEYNAVRVVDYTILRG